MAISIKIENLSKIYRLGEIGTGTISRDIERWIARLRGKEDPFLKIGQTNDRTSRGEGDIVYSLKNVSFDIKQGDTVGIVGRNGAGKSTLLKILSRVTSPTTGKISIKGRVASLLEVGTGFHPDLTGRENIFLNGAILGMRKKEIQRKLDEIIDFSGVERYIDTPVKRYSSGMYVRLAFAVAAHLESEILIVDEVLAVGDAEFQKKCLGKMGDVSKSDGRTVLFVSHNTSSIKELCRTGIILDKGQVKYVGSSIDSINLYIGSESHSSSYKYLDIKVKNFHLIDISVRNNPQAENNLLYRDRSIEVIIKYNNHIQLDSILYFNIRIKDDQTGYILTTNSDLDSDLISLGEGYAIMEIPANFFTTGKYNLDVLLIQKNKLGFVCIIEEIDVLNIEILPEKGEYTWRGKELGPIRPKFNWNKI